MIPNFIFINSSKWTQESKITAMTAMQQLKPASLQPAAAAITRNKYTISSDSEDDIFNGSRSAAAPSTQGPPHKKVTP